MSDHSHSSVPDKHHKSGVSQHQAEHHTETVLAPIVVDSVSTRFEFILRVHGYADEQVRYAEAKSALIWGTCSFLLSVPLARPEGLAEVFLHASAPARFGLIVLGLLLSALLVFTIAQCVRCIFPYLGSFGDSKVYVGDIAGPSHLTPIQRRERQQAYVEAIASLTDDEATRAMAGHVFELSAVAMRKHYLVQRALKGLLAVFLLCLVIGLYCSVLATLVRAHG